jgi:DNA-binding GntR family transcriptional regulator
MSGRVVPPPNISQRTRLSDEVASYVRDLIMAGELRPAQVVNIDLFAREIGVSATPVREALMVLVSEGFLLTERHRGFVVAPLDRQDIKDVFEVHASIGGELAARAARRATDEFIAKLEKLQDTFEEALEKEDLATADNANTEFHETIVNHAESAKLAWLFDIGVRFVPRSVFYSPESPVAQHKKNEDHGSVLGHHEILNALRAQDDEQARIAMAAHISHASKLLLKHLERTGLWDGEVTEVETAEALQT